MPLPRTSKSVAMNVPNPASVVLTRAIEIASGDRLRAEQWYHSPLPAFGGRSPEELVGAGKLNVVLQYLESIESGYVG